MALVIFKPSSARGLSSCRAAMVRLAVSRPGTVRRPTALRGQAAAKAAGTSPAARPPGVIARFVSRLLLLPQTDRFPSRRAIWSGMIVVGTRFPNGATHAT